MHVSENAERRWREFFADPRNSHRKDALSRAMQGVLPVDGDPLRDPLFLPADVAARREYRAHLCGTGDAPGAGELLLFRLERH
jgi:hypothetical protein